MTIKIFYDNGNSCPAAYIKSLQEL